MTSLPFVRSSGNYADFLVTIRDGPSLQQAMQQLGAARLRLGHASVYAIGYPEHPAIGRTLFSGVGKDGGALILGPSVRLGCPEPIGQWVAVEIAQNSIGIRTDFLGMAPVFYSDRIVTNRLHLAALALESEGLLKLNTKSIASFFFQETGFNYQLAVWDTPIQGISLAPAGATIIINGSITVEKSAHVEERLSQDEYRSLIRRGAEEILENVNAALETSPHVTCGITGGRDSRVILAALVAGGRIKDVNFVTLDVGRDIEIATGLVKKFGGSYGPRPVREFLIRTFDDALMKRSSIYFGLYHHLLPTSVATVVGLQRPPVVRLTGGCGELYRDHYQKSAFPVQATDVDCTAESLRCLLSQHGYWREMLPESHLDEIFEPYWDTFETLRGSTISQKLDSHYLNFRNRFHFGMSAYLHLQTFTEWHPLASPSILRATWGIPTQVKRTGRVLFDVTRELCEELAYCEYETMAPDFSLVPFHTPSRYDGQTIIAPAAPELIAASVASHKKRSAPYPTVAAIDLQEFVWSDIRVKFQHLRDSKLGRFASDGAWKRIEWLRAKKSSNLVRWFSKIDGILNYLNIGMSSKNSARLD
jgi:hypothetical protein